MSNPSAQSASAAGSKPDVFSTAATAAVSPEIKSLGLPPRKEIMLGHICSTMSSNPTIRDTDMEIPPSWATKSSNPKGSLTVTPDPGPETVSAKSPSQSTNPDTGEAENDQSSPTRGHNQLGRTVCVHSLAVLPQFQGRGLGMLLMKAYIERIQTAAIADRLALLAHDELVPFYEKLGFRKVGKSEATFGGATWVDMVSSDCILDDSGS